MIIIIEEDSRRLNAQLDLNQLKKSQQNEIWKKKKKVFNLDINNINNLIHENLYYTKRSDVA